MPFELIQTAGAGAPTSTLQPSFFGAFDGAPAAEF
jgi:hypothetical protein